MFVLCRASSFGRKAVRNTRPDALVVSANPIEIRHKAQTVMNPKLYIRKLHPSSDLLAEQNRGWNLSNYQAILEAGFSAANSL